MTFLATSFQTWLPHQPSNSSDDLLALLQQSPIDATISFLRQLPVNTDHATQAIATAIYTHQPKIVLCCGMAETRQHLNLEKYARNSSTTLRTSIPIDELVGSMPNTRISHDAGSFVCNATYYHLLHRIERERTELQALFVHVPVLTPHNRHHLLTDFCTLIDRLSDRLAEPSIEELEAVN